MITHKIRELLNAFGTQKLLHETTEDEIL